MPSEDRGERATSGRARVPRAVRAVCAGDALKQKDGRHEETRTRDLYRVNFVSTKHNLSPALPDSESQLPIAPPIRKVSATIW